MDDADARAARIEEEHRAAMAGWAAVAPAAIELQDAFAHDRWDHVVVHGPPLLAGLEAAGRMGQVYAALTRLVIGRSYSNLEDLAASVVWLRAALVDHELLGDDAHDARFVLAYAQARLGDLGGLATTLDALEASGSAGHVAGALRLRSVLVWWTTGDLAEAGALLEQSVVADPPPETGIWWHDAAYRVQFLHESGRTREALPLALMGLEQQRAHDSGHWSARMDLGLTASVASRILTAEDRVDDGLALAEEALAMVGERAYPRSCALLARGEARTALGDLSGAEGDLDAAMLLSARQQTRPVATSCIRARMELARAAGDDPEPFRRQGAEAAASIGHVVAARWFEG